MKHKVLYLSVILVILAAAITPIPANAATNIKYVVQPGDTLGSIARTYCTTWQAIYNLNSAAIGPDPNRIRSGMVLTVPANCSAGGTPQPSGVVDQGSRLHATGTYKAPNYTVARGDWLSAIGQRFGVPWQDIQKANHLSSTTIYTGQVLKIPGASGTTPPPPTPSGTAERVRFATGATSATRTGTITSGVAKTYVLKAMAGQTMYVAGTSYGEALTVVIKRSNGVKLTTSGTNGKVNFSVNAYLPVTDDYYVTFKPVAQTNPKFKFDVTFTIP